MRTNGAVHARWRSPAWFYTSTVAILLCISILEAFKTGFGTPGFRNSGDSFSIARRQASNSSATTTIASTTVEPTSAPASTSSSSETTASDVPVTTTTASESTPTTPPPTSESSGSGTGSNGGSSGGDGAGTGAVATTTAISDTTTTAAAPAPVATGGTTDSSNSDSGSNSGTSDSGTSTPTDADDSSANSSANGSETTSTGSDSGDAGNTAGDPSGSVAGGNAGTADTGAGTVAAPGSGDTGNTVVGLATASGAPAPTGGAADNAATSVDGSKPQTAVGSAPGNSADAADAATAPANIELSTSLGTPVTLAPVTVRSSAARTMITTGTDGKPTPTTSSFVSTFVTTPVSTPSSVVTSTSHATPSQAGAAGQQSSNGGLSTGAKVTVGVLIPLIAIMFGIAVAVYLMRKHNRKETDDEKSSKWAISGPIPIAGSLDPLKRFSSLKVQDIEHPDHEPINQPSLPALRTPASSMYQRQSGSAGPGTALGRSLTIPANSDSPRTGSGMSGSTIGASAPHLRTLSAQSTISSVSAYSRESHYSHYTIPDDINSQMPSLPPPLPTVSTQQTRTFENPDIKAGGATSTLHPYDALVGNARSASKRDSTNFDAASATSALSFTSDHPSQSPSKAPSITGVSLLGTNNAPEVPRNRSLTAHNDDAMKHLSTISDAPGADARATQLYYPFGEQVMTPGGRIVPTPVGPNPKNITPGLGGLRPDGSSSANAINHNPSFSRPSPASTAPTLPQLLEAQEDTSSYAGLDFDFGDISDPLTLTDVRAGAVKSAHA